MRKRWRRTADDTREMGVHLGESRCAEGTDDLKMWIEVACARYDQRRERFMQQREIGFRQSTRVDDSMEVLTLKSSQGEGVKRILA